MTVQRTDLQKTMTALEKFQAIQASLSHGDRALLIVSRKNDQVYLEAKKQSELGFFDTIRRWFGARKFLLENVKLVTEKVLSSTSSISEGTAAGKTVDYIQDKLMKKYVGKEEKWIPKELMAKLLAPGAVVVQQQKPKPVESSPKKVASRLQEPESVTVFVEKNLQCKSDFRRVEKIIPFIASPEKNYRAYSRVAVDGGESYLAFLGGDIAERNVQGDTRSCAVVNAANEMASHYGGGITGALGAICDGDQWEQRTEAAKGGPRQLEVGECVVIDQPFTADIGVKKLFHSLGRAYGSNVTLDDVKKDLEKVYREIFRRAREHNLDTIVCPMISGEIFAPGNISKKDWAELNSSFFIAEANRWLAEKSDRCAVLIGYKKIPGNSFFDEAVPPK